MRGLLLLSHSCVEWYLYIFIDYCYSSKSSPIYLKAIILTKPHFSDCILERIDVIFIHTGSSVNFSQLMHVDFFWI